MDKTGLQTLIGHTANSDDGQRTWALVIKETAAAQLDRTTGCDEGKRIYQVPLAEQNYYWLTGYVAGAGGAAAMAQGQAAHEEATLWIDISSGALDTGIHVGAQAVGGRLGGPPGRALGGLIGDALAFRLHQAATALKQDMSVATRAATAYRSQTACQALQASLASWNLSFSQSGPDSQDPLMHVISGEQVKESLNAGYVLGGDGKGLTDVLDADCSMDG